MLACCSRKQNRNVKQQQAFLGGSAYVACTTTALQPYAFIPAQAGLATKDWMHHLPDATPLYKVSMPGTHDSATATVLGVTVGPTHLLPQFGQCQCLSVLQQLQIGVRFLDLRVKLIGTEVKLFHGPMDCHVLLVDILTDVSQFLTTWATEFIFLKIKLEGGDDALALTNAINHLIDGHIPVAHRLADWTAESTVQHLRGKALFVDDIMAPGTVDGEHNTLITTSVPLDNLFTRCNRTNNGNTDVHVCSHLCNYKDIDYGRQAMTIKNFIEWNNKHCTAGDVVVEAHTLFSAGWNINTFSATKAATAPTPLTNAIAMNEHALKLLGHVPPAQITTANPNIDVTHRVGIQMFDFITLALVTAVIRHNPAVKTALTLA